MKAGDLQKCALCGKGVLHNGVPLFWRVSLQRMGVDLAAVQRAAGLEMLLGGNVALARILGPNEDVATPVGEGRTILICEQCAGEQTSVYRLGLPE
jgi:hypothetical protein